MTWTLLLDYNRRSMGTIAEILDPLQKLPCPTFDSVWLGPFEQLLGAGYALLSATKHGIYTRSLDSHYNQAVQAKVTSHLRRIFSETDVSSADRFEDWVSGFYFNSAIQRMVWAGERLLLTCSAIDCSCGRRQAEPSVMKDRPPWRDVLAGALNRIDHVQNDDGLPLAKCHAVREQFIIRDASGNEREYRRDDPLDSTKVLAMLRYDVNNRKHKAYGRSKVLDRCSSGKGDNAKWHTAGADFQMRLACDAFALLCAALEELMSWHPQAKL